MKMAHSRSNARARQTLRGSAQLEPRELALVAPAPEDLAEADGAGAVLPGGEPGVAGDLPLVVVVAGRALRVEALGDHRGAADLVHPRVLAVLRRLDDAVPSRPDLAQDVGEVPRLLVERVDQVDGQRGL